MGWEEYWQKKKHKPKRLCTEFMGIDSFCISEDNRDRFVFNNNFENDRNRYAFNNNDGDCNPILTVEREWQALYFSIHEPGRELRAELLSDGFHVSLTEFYQNSTVRLPIVTNQLTYMIPVEKLTSNGKTFFHCPGTNCKRRVRKLYYERGLFLCRECLNLGYRSQTITPKNRLSLLSDEERVGLWRCAMNDDTANGTKALFRLMLALGMMSQKEFNEYDKMEWDDDELAS
jgi:hypothetical protein